jgi:pSer/pThr/pTyr-binding forkhead associated (FHA) protein
LAYLRLETEDGERRIALDRDCVTIGRAPSNDLVIHHHQISRHHAELRLGAEGWWIADLGSTNGVQVRGRRVERHVLQSGDRVQLAPTVFLTLGVEGPAHDISVQPTTYAPAVSLGRGAVADSPTRGLGEAVAPAWLPSSSATAWTTPRPGEKVVQERGEPGPVEGDLFRRRRTRVSGGPSAISSPDANGPVYGLAAAHLHLCQTCGQQTAPGSLRCQACGCSIAHACESCGLSLLPIQDVCPRCQSPNTASVFRTRTASKPA